MEIFSWGLQNCHFLCFVRSGHKANVPLKQLPVCNVCSVLHIMSDALYVKLNSMTETSISGNFICICLFVHQLQESPPLCASSRGSQKTGRSFLSQSGNGATFRTTARTFTRQANGNSLQRGRMTSTVPSAYLPDGCLSVLSVCRT